MNKYIAEFYGTFLLLLSIVGTAHMMTSMNSPEYITLFAISIAAGAILFCNISLFMKVSGAHFNPAVSLMMLLRGNINIKDFSLYSIMQILGGISAVLCVHIMFGENPVGISQIDRSSTNILLGEFIATLGLLIVIIHGDRIESLACAQAAVFNNFKVAHIEGGEITGSLDEIIRHAITKLSHIHFVSNYKAKKRGGVKRHKNSIYLEGLKPNYSVKGKVVRYDVYNSS